MKKCFHNKNNIKDNSKINGKEPRSYHSLRNQNGGMAALLSVIVLSMVIVTSLSSVYIYLENRAKFQGRLKMSYQITYTMEEIARIASQGFDIASQVGDPLNTAASLACPTGMVKSIQNAQPNDIAICVPEVNVGANGNGICVTNENVSSVPVCVSSISNINTETMVAENSLLEKWYEKLDKFFDTTVVTSAPKAKIMAWNFLETQFQPPTYLGWLLPTAANASEAWAEYHGVETPAAGEQSYYDQLRNAYQNYFNTEAQAGTSVESGTNVEVQVEEVTQTDETGENFLELNPTYVAGNLTVTEVTNSGGYTEGIGGDCTGDNCTTTTVVPARVTITTNPCDTNSTSQVVSDHSTNGRSCFRCAASVPGATGAAATPCFDMQMTNPLAGNIACSDSNSKCFNMSVRLVR